MEWLVIRYALAGGAMMDTSVIQMEGGVVPPLFPLYGVCSGRLPISRVYVTSHESINSDIHRRSVAIARRRTSATSLIYI
jgi:hypothetical protein